MDFQRLVQQDTSVKDWLKRHALYWLALIPLITLSWVYWSQSFSQAITAALLSSALRYIPTTYLFLYLVLPKLMQERYRTAMMRFVIWIVLSFALRYILWYVIPLYEILACGCEISSDPTLKTDSLRHLFDASFMVTNSFVIVAASLKLFRYQYLKEQANQQLAQETLLMELQVLKAQIHPHFFFNTLNNIYSLTLKGSQKAAEIVQKLSALMRYMFQECDQPLVRLTDEVELLGNYMELERVRYGSRLKVKMQVDGALIGHGIVPLLLLPFVENAFKHGASEQTGHAEISFYLSVSSDILIFKIINSTNRVSGHASGKPGGLGLQNVRKRLALLYPDRHTLVTDLNQNHFYVELTIPLQQYATEMMRKDTLLNTTSIPLSLF